MENLQKNEIRLIVRALVDGDDLEVLPIAFECGDAVKDLDEMEKVLNIAAIAANVPAAVYKEAGFSATSALEFTNCAIVAVYSEDGDDA